MDPKNPANLPIKSIYWRSLEELAQTQQFQEWVQREFPKGAAEFLEGTSRRRFLQVMAASLGLAGLTSCRWPKEKIVPYANRPENRMPGTTAQYATAMELGGAALGLLATSYDGRPIKIEGNPKHPGSRGAAGVIAQAAILEIYDPDRSRYPIQRDINPEQTRTWEETTEFIKNHFATLKNQSGKGFYILSESSSSPTFGEMKKRLLNTFPEARWHEYESISRDNVREGTRLAFSQALRVHYKLDQAKIILSLDADFLGSHPASIQYAGDFASSRKPKKGEMNRLYAVESTFTTTGAMADHRLPLPAGEIEAFALALAAELVFNRKLQLPEAYSALKNLLERFRHHHFAVKWLQALAKDLAEHQGAGLVACGAQHSPLLQALTILLNELLGNTGKTVVYLPEIEPERPTHIDSLRSLVEDIKNGKVQTLLILGGNPVFDAPVDLDFTSQLKKVSQSIHLSLYDNETSALCSRHIPRAHFLESWGDVRAYDGTISIIQPLIQPLYEGKTDSELLALITADSLNRGYDLVRRTLSDLKPSSDFEKNWRQWLNDGIIADTSLSPILPTMQIQSILAAIEKQSQEQKELSLQNLEIVFTPDSKIYDGRFANNGWLQETPDYLTKLTWDNAALIGIKTADELQVEHGDLIQIHYKNRKLEVPVYVMPGQPSHSIAIALGYGRSRAGHVGNGVGFPIYTLRTSEASYFDSGVTITKTKKKYALACTQDHWAIDNVGMKERARRIPELVHEASLEELAKDPEHFQHHTHPPPPKLWQEHEYPGNRWGMAIDLNTCIGCNACVTACQAENNIPVVGKEQVLRSREMHWLRIDRYFRGHPENPKIAHQPVACVHCEKAPCEQVCPVAATVHDAEGLNVMVYNRCVGTRYCSNNCPYKARRFNFFNYHPNVSDLEKMMYNPEVTVRSRGVMEKCTFCIQRIENAKIKAKNERRPIAEGEIVPACAQTCPTQAITFGDLNLSGSAVKKKHEDSRAYFLLAELNINPRTAFLTRIQNPNPELVESEHEVSVADA